MKIVVCLQPGLFEYSTGEQPGVQKNHSIIDQTNWNLRNPFACFEGTPPYFDIHVVRCQLKKQKVGRYHAELYCVH